MTKTFVDLNDEIGHLSPMVFSHFIEHMHRCMYGGVYEEGSPRSDERGIRQDVFEAAKALKMGNLRWPGGNFVSGYHWEDGIGPKENRPARMELAWHGIESNQFGTDEFIQYCRGLGTEPHICINLGTGTLDEARNWVEYCNGTKDTYYTNLRRKNGHPEPYNVKYWGLGNEMHGAWQQSTRSAPDYATYAREAAKLMKWVDPSIKLISCGHDGVSEWDWTVLQTLAPLVNYHSIHIYTGSNDYYTNVFLPHHAERCMRTVAGMIASVRYQQRIAHPIKIAYDEWNVWTFDKATQDNGYEQVYNMGDAVAVGTYLNGFIRCADILGMANLAQLANVLGLMLTRTDGLVLQSIYYPLVLYAEFCGAAEGGATAVRSYVKASNSERQSIESTSEPEIRKRIDDLGPFTYLDVSAVHAPDRKRVAVFVTNRHMEKEQCAEISIQGLDWSGPARAKIITADSPEAHNTFEKSDAISHVEETIPVSHGQASFMIPPHSVAVLEVRYDS
jgi:alpha-N-arabinofuranosidase